jgi:hypothetical protein
MNKNSGATMNTKLKVGDVVRITKSIDAEQKSHVWKTGYYRVTGIGNMMKNGIVDPKLASYTFQKIRRDGTAYSGYVGYDVGAFDSMDNWEKV